MAATESTVHVLVVDDHAIVREALETAINRASDMNLVGQAASGAEAIEMALELRPDVTLMDLRMPETGGVQAVTEIRAAWPEARIIILTSFDEEDDIVKAFQAGARGYLLKGSRSQEVLDAIRVVNTGGSLIAPSVAATLIERMASSSNTSTDGGSLTTRETEIVQLIAEGRTNREIGTSLGIAEGTVKTHISHLFAKLEVSDRTEAVMKAVRGGLIKT